MPALAARLTGKLVWIFHSVPHPGEFGYDTWPKDFWKTGGGVHNWSEFSVDEKHGIVFIPFGTARFDFYGANRRGQNLFGKDLPTTWFSLCRESRKAKASLAADQRQ